MKFRSVILVTLLAAALLADTALAARRMGNSKEVGHRRSKRTLGSIINWKLNLLQSIFGGITSSISGFFGGGNNNNNNRPSYGPPGGGGGGRPSYGPPGKRPSQGYGPPSRPRPRPPGKRPSYNGGGGSRPSYNGGGGGGRPSYGGGGGGGGGGRPSYGGGRPQGPPQQQHQQQQPIFGPSNAIKMLPAPNLATAAPQVGVPFSTNPLMPIRYFCTVSRGHFQLTH